MPETDTDDNSPKKEIKTEQPKNQSGMKCIGILPGIGSYNDSSDTDCSSDSEAEYANPVKYDLLGRKIEIKSEDKS